jgi:hypothetical protein
MGSPSQGSALKEEVVARGAPPHHGVVVKHLGQLLVQVGRGEELVERQPVWEALHRRNHRERRARPLRHKHAVCGTRKPTHRQPWTSQHRRHARHSLVDVTVAAPAACTAQHPWHVTCHSTGGMLHVTEPGACHISQHRRHARHSTGGQPLHVEVGRVEAADDKGGHDSLEGAVPRLVPHAHTLQAQLALFQRRRNDNSIKGARHLLRTGKPPAKPSAAPSTAQELPFCARQRVCHPLAAANLGKASCQLRIPLMQGPTETSSSKPQQVLGPLACCPPDYTVPRIILQQAPIERPASPPSASADTMCPNPVANHAHAPTDRLVCLVLSVCLPRRAKHLVPRFRLGLVVLCTPCVQLKEAALGRHNAVHHPIAFQPRARRVQQPLRQLRALRDRQERPHQCERDARVGMDSQL